MHSCMHLYFCFEFISFEKTVALKPTTETLNSIATVAIARGAHDLSTTDCA